MLEHYSHIRNDAKRQALDALDEQRNRGLHEPNGAEGATTATMVAVSEELTSQFGFARGSAFRYTIGSTQPERCPSG